jgi:hypothetical protein
MMTTDISFVGVCRNIDGEEFFVIAVHLPVEAATEMTDEEKIGLATAIIAATSTGE